MSTARHSRAVALPVPTWALPDLRRWGARVLVFAFCLSSALLLTALRLEITRLRYDLSSLYSQREALGAEISRLEVEMAAQAAPRRIEERARKMGLVYPDRESIIVLDE